MKRTLLILLFLTAVSFRTMAQSGDTELNAYYISDASYSQQPFTYTRTCNTTTYTNQFFDGPNSIGTIANDVFYRFYVSGTFVVTATNTSTINTVLWIYDHSGTPVRVLAHGDGSTGIRVTLSSGEYYLVAEGLYSNGSITTTITFERLGDRLGIPIDAGTFSQSMDYHDNCFTSSYSNQYTGQSTKDVFYKFTLTNGMIVNLTHDGSTVTDTYMYLLNSSGTKIAQNTSHSGAGTSKIRTYLESGTYYVVSEGYSTDGYIKTNISGELPPVGDTRENAINAGTFSDDFSYSSTVNTNNYSNRHAGRSTNDVFHKLVLSRPMTVTFTHEGSELNDTYMSLLNSSGGLFASNNDYSGESHCSSTGQSFIQCQLAAGTYYVVSEGYSSEGEITLNITGCTSTEYGYSSIPSTYSTKSGPVGAMGGTFGVSPTGGATYTIPIKVPAGVGGLQPQLAIVYNSQAGNGVAGYGTSLSGLSSITRGAKDIYHDGSARGMTYGSDDALYLDGVRLILVSGTAGQDGAIYSPESDPFTQVTVHGSCTSTSNSIWYEVQTGDGMRYTYGSDQYSRHTYTVNGVQKVNSWYINYAYQPSGNYINYYYVKEDNSVYITLIAYGTNLNQGSPLSNCIFFRYENRDDESPFVFDGTAGKRGKRLKYIISQTVDDVLRKYTLNYEVAGDGTATKFSRLVSVTEQNGDEESLTTAFTWSYMPAPTNNNTGVTVYTPSNIPSGVSLDTGGQAFVSGDMNGDGLDDLISLTPATKTSNGHTSQCAVVNIHYLSFAS